MLLRYLRVVLQAVNCMLEVVLQDQEPTRLELSRAAALGISAQPKALLQRLLQQRFLSPADSHCQSCLRDLISCVSVLYANKLAVHACAKATKSGSLNFPSFFLYCHLTLTHCKILCFARLYGSHSNTFMVSFEPVFLPLSG